MLRLVLALFLVPALALAAGTPIVVSHTGYLLESNDQPVQSEALSFTFRIFDTDVASTLEEVRWSATCQLAVTDGHYSASLGALACAGDGLDTQDLPFGEPRFLEVSVGTVALSPRLRLGTVPTAALAHDAEKLGGVPAAAYALRSDVPSVAADSLKLGGVDAEAYALAANVTAGDAARYTKVEADERFARTLSAGDGMSLSNDTLSVAFGSGPTQVAPGNHHHDDVYARREPTGGVRFQNDTAACEPENLGVMRFVNGAFEGCTSAGWTKLNDTQPQTITFPQPAEQYLQDETLALAVSASSGLPVSVASTTSPVCTVSGSTVTFVAVGTCTLLATQPGNGPFAAASPVVRSFPVAGLVATGGTVTNINLEGVKYRVHTFTTVGNSTFTASKAGLVEALVVAGGGGGGSGGGGGGGFLTGTVEVTTAEPYIVTVGGGGAASSALTQGGGNGGASIFASFNAVGGGGGGGNDQRYGLTHGPKKGGSGGGAGASSTSPNFLGAPGVSGQGHAGGLVALLTPYAGAGGGGAGAPGGNGSPGMEGEGGAGRLSLITGTPTHYAGGGGGRYNSTTGPGGIGGGGASNVAGTPNTGGGGGGLAAGGSGIVIIRYRVP